MKPHFDLGNGLLLGDIDVSCEYHTYDIWFCALDVGDG